VSCNSSAHLSLALYVDIQLKEKRINAQTCTGCVLLSLDSIAADLDSVQNAHDACSAIKLSMAINGST